MSHYPNGMQQIPASSGLLRHTTAEAQIWTGAAAASNTATQPPNGLMLDAGAIMVRLSEIRHRIAVLNDRLNGARTESPNIKDNSPQEPDTMRRLTDRSMYLVNEIEMEIAEIEAKL